LEPALKGLADFLRNKEVSLAASLPCYLKENVRAQRGDGVFEKSIHALKVLNKLGYGRNDGPCLDLVFNPGGPRLPGKQTELETAYKKELYHSYGVSFSRLLTVTNMPIGRFRSYLDNQGLAREYLALLRSSFNRRVLGELMCRRQVSVDWDGTLYDCDFNLALALPAAKKPTILRNLTVVLLHTGRLLPVSIAWGAQQVAVHPVEDRWRQTQYEVTCIYPIP
jgi:radical SAM/Cys-rich protein